MLRISDERLELEKGGPPLGVPVFDQEFKPGSAHMAIIKEARRNGGVYDRKGGIEKIGLSSNEDKMKQKMLLWHKLNIDTLVRAGYLLKIDGDKLKLNPLLPEKAKAFTPSPNHVKLLEKNKGGAISVSDLKKGVRSKDPNEMERQRKMQQGMIKNLHEAGYLDKASRGEYRITEKGQLLLLEKKNWIPSDKKGPARGFNITSFDRHIKEVCSDGAIDYAKLGAHIKKDSILKRIKTLEANGMIVEGKTTKEFGLLLGRALEMNKKLSLDSLSMEQLNIIKDIRIFQNITGSQLVRYVYGEENRIMATTEINFLVKNKILKINEHYDMYVFDEAGVKLSDSLFPKAVKYGSKLLSRAEELEHDMLVYSAYREWLKKVENSGGKIIEIKNDRQMRKEGAEANGFMQGSYPDLRVFYKLPFNENTLQYDLEVDNGYRDEIIIKKISGIAGEVPAGPRNSSGAGPGEFNAGTGAGGYHRGGGTGKGLGWYCRAAAQAVKVMKAVKRAADTKRINSTRDINIFYFDDDMNLRHINN